MDRRGKDMGLIRNPRSHHREHHEAPGVPWRRLYNLFTAVLILSAWPCVYGFQNEIYKAYISSRMDLWKEAMVKMEIRYRATGDHGLLCSLTEAQYGYIAHCLSENRRDEARGWLDKAEDNIGLLLEKNPNSSRAYSIRGALYGYRLLLEPLKAPALGRRSMNANETALKLGPGEPWGWMEKGNMEFYKPAVLGGSAKQAIPHYKKAVELFEALPGQTSGNWLYLNCLVNLGLAYEKNGQIVEAGKVYEKILAHEPSFSWVRDDLYPDCRKKLARNEIPE
jgi:tetratricopeptide (TPR) repeat protein